MKTKIGMDLDGTILDSRVRHQKVLYDILREYHLEISYNSLNDYIEFKSNGNNTVTYLREKQVPDPLFISQLWIKKIEEWDYLIYDTLYPEVIKVLKRLMNTYEIYVVTARKNKDNAVKQADDLGIFTFVESMIVVDHGANAGHNKYIATRQLGLSHIIGDTEVDLEWAKLLGVSFTAVNYGFRSKGWWDRQNMKSYHSITVATNQL